MSNGTDADLPDRETNYPNDEDRQIFDSITADVRTKPGDYIEAGRWLDERYSQAAIAKRDEAQTADVDHDDRESMIRTCQLFAK